MSHTTDTGLTYIVNTVSLPMMNILYLPADALRIVFGVADVINEYDDYVRHYPEHWKKLDPIALDATLLCTVGRHVCKWLADIIGGRSPRYTAELAAQANQFSVLRWAISAGYYPDECVDICKFAARNGNLQMLEWAKSRGYTLNKYVAVAAARGGHAEVFMYLVDKCPVENTRVIAAAMKGGNIEILEYLKCLRGRFRYNNGLSPYYPTIFKHISVATFAWSCVNGLKLDLYILCAAIRVKRQDIVEWIFGNYSKSFWWDDYKVEDAVAQSGSIHILEMLIEHRYLSDSPQFDRVYTTSITAEQFHVCEYLETNRGMSLRSVGIHQFDLEFLWPSELESTSWMIKKGLLPPADAIKRFISNCVNPSAHLTDNKKDESIKEFILLLVKNGFHIPPDAPDVFTTAAMPELAEWIRGIM